MPFNMYFSLLFLEIVKYTLKLKCVDVCNQLHECWIFFFFPFSVIKQKTHSSNMGTVKVQGNYSSSNFSAFS